MAAINKPTEGKRYVPKGQEMVPVWQPGEHPDLEPHRYIYETTTLIDYYSGLDWQPRLQQMEDGKAAIIFSSPDNQAGANAPANGQFKLFARTVSVDASRTLGPVKKIYQPGNNYKYCEYGLTWGRDSTGENWILAYAEDGYKGKDLNGNQTYPRSVGMVCILLDPELNVISTDYVESYPFAVDPSYVPGSQFADAHGFTTQSLVYDGVIWSLFFDQSAGSSYQAVGLVKITESGGSFSAQLVSQGQFGPSGNNEPNEIIQHGDRLLMPCYDDIGVLTCEVSDPSGTMQLIPSTSIPILDPDWSSTAVIADSNSGGRGQKDGLAKPSDPNSAYWFGTVQDFDQYPDGDAWPSILELRWTGSTYECVNVSTLYSPPFWYEGQTDTSTPTDDHRYYGYVNGPNGYQGPQFYVFSYMGPGWPRFVRALEDKVFLGTGTYNYNNAPPYIPFAANTSVWEITSDPQKNYQAAYGNDGPIYDNTNLDAAPVLSYPNWLTTRYSSTFNDPALWIYESDGATDFVPGSNGCLVLMANWFDVQRLNSADYVEIELSHLMWVTPSTPPLRHMQRDDQLSLRSGNARLNVPGVGTATSYQESRAPRLSNKQYS